METRSGREGSPQPPAAVLGEPSPAWSTSAGEREDAGGKLGVGAAEPGARKQSRCPRLMNMQEPPPSLRDVTGRPGVSA